jgi:hypothetical protein
MSMGMARCLPMACWARSTFSRKGIKLSECTLKSPSSSGTCSKGVREQTRQQWVSQAHKCKRAAVPRLFSKRYFSSQSFNKPPAA